MQSQNSNGNTNNNTMIPQEASIVIIPSVISQILPQQVPLTNQYYFNSNISNNQFYSNLPNPNSQNISLTRPYYCLPNPINNRNTQIAAIQKSQHMNQSRFHPYEKPIQNMAFDHNTNNINSKSNSNDSNKIDQITKDYQVTYKTTYNNFTINRHPNTIQRKSYPQEKRYILPNITIQCISKDKHKFEEVTVLVELCDNHNKVIPNYREIMYPIDELEMIPSEPLEAKLKVYQNGECYKFKFTIKYKFNNEWYKEEVFSRAFSVRSNKTIDRSKKQTQKAILDYIPKKGKSGSIVWIEGYFSKQHKVYFGLAKADILDIQPNLIKCIVPDTGLNIDNEIELDLYVSQVPIEPCDGPSPFKFTISRKFEDYTHNSIIFSSITVNSNNVTRVNLIDINNNDNSNNNNNNTN
jgi:hypothetical protein